MNTRRKFVQAKPDAPSARWHLMKEAFKDIFAPQARKHVEDWYNLGATGVQRDLFREICSEIYQCDPNAPEPPNRTRLTATIEGQEADLMIKYCTKTLTELGKRKARCWIVQTNVTSSNANHARRRRDNFRDVFVGCQTVFENKTVMHTDYTPPEKEAYPDDRTNFHRSVDWTSLKARDEMQALQAHREDGTASSAATAVVDIDQRPSVVVANRARAGKPLERFTKPKNQFDGVNNLTSLGFADDVPAEVALAQLKAKHDAFASAKTYYVDSDGSTVYVAGSSKPGPAGGCNRNVGGGGILASVTSEPMTQWKVKTVDA